MLGIFCNQVHISLTEVGVINMSNISSSAQTAQNAILLGICYMDFMHITCTAYQICLNELRVVKWGRG